MREFKISAKSWRKFAFGAYLGSRTAETPASVSALNSIALAAQIAGRALFTLCVPFVTIPREYGAYAYLSWTVNIVIAISTLGLPYTAQRYLPAMEDRSTRKGLECFLHQISLVLFIAAMAIIAVLTLLGVMPYSTDFSLGIIVTTAAAGAFTTVRYGILRGERKFSQIIIGECLGNLARLIALAIVVFLHVHLTGIMILYLESSYWAAQFMYGLWQRPFRGFHGTHVADRGEVFKYIASVAFIAFLDMMVLQRLEIAFLTHWATESDAGYFNLAMQLAVAITIIPVAATSGLFSTFVRYNSASADHANDLYDRTSTLAWILVFPLIGFSMLIAPIAVKIVYGARYAKAAAILPMILISRGLVIVNTTASIFLYAIGRRKQILLLSAITAGSSLTFDIVFIRFGGLVGAALATVAVQLIVTVAIFRLMQTDGHVRCGLRRSTALGGLATLGIECGLLMKSHGIAAFLAISAFLILSHFTDSEIPKAISMVIGKVRAFLAASPSISRLSIQNTSE